MNLEVGSSCSNMIFIFNFHSSEYFVWFEDPESGSGQSYQEFEGPEQLEVGESGRRKLSNGNFSNHKNYWNLTMLAHSSH